MKVYIFDGWCRSPCASTVKFPSFQGHITKVNISVDIEGVAGITHWDEAEKAHPDYPEFREQMTREAVAAIEGAQAAGAKEIWINDAHDSGRNLITSMLPADMHLIRCLAGHPLCMVQELAC